MMQMFICVLLQLTYILHYVHNLFIFHWYTMFIANKFTLNIAHTDKFFHNSPGT